MAALILVQQLNLQPARAEQCTDIFRQMEAEQKHCDSYRNDPFSGPKSMYRAHDVRRTGEWQNLYNAATAARDEMVSKNCNFWGRKDLPECVTINRRVEQLESALIELEKEQQLTAREEGALLRKEEAKYCESYVNLKAEFERECVHTARRAPRARGTETVRTDPTRQDEATEDDGIEISPALPRLRPRTGPTYQPRPKAVYQPRTKGPSVYPKQGPAIRVTPQRTTVVRTVPPTSVRTIPQRTTVIRIVPRTSVRTVPQRTTVIRTAPRTTVIRAAPRQRCHMKAGRLHCGSG